MGKLAFLDRRGGCEFLNVVFCFLLECIWRMGEFGEDLVGWRDGFGGVNGAPADGLVDAVEDGREGVFHSHVFGGLSRKRQIPKSC